MPLNVLVPTVIEQTHDGERAMDIFSRLLNHRAVFMNGEVTDVSVQLIIAQLFHLSFEDDKSPISLYINSPGGSVHAGLALHDAIRHIKAPVHTIVMGLAASMGSFIANAGEQGHRYVLPESTTMVHRVSSGTRGTQGTIHEQELQWEDAQASRNHSIHLNNRLTVLYAKYNTKGKTVEEFHEIMKHDTYLTAEQAVEYGLADQILQP